ncbi:MAG: anthranilate synthase component I [Christensenellaceae bacterium]|jgi:anthranilate synthase component 1|nr:anthranilate synthase component I [Christensenellaceae bacterium]
MAKPERNELRELAAQGFGMIPIGERLPLQGLTPARAFQILKNLSRQCFILESAEDAGRYGRYTFLGYDPKLELSCRGGEMTIKSGAELRFETRNPAEQIRRVLEESRAPRLDWLPPFSGGLVGYFSYDYIQYMEESLRFQAGDEESFKDVDLMLFDKVIAFDHLENELILIANARGDAPDENYNRAIGEIAHMKSVLFEGKPAEIPPLRLKSDFHELFSEEEYCSMVERAKAYIREGDIFQVVLSNRLDAKAEGSLFETYRILRETNPSPYMFYFSSDDIEIAGAAPETLVKVSGDAVFTFPLAGTRPRGATEEEDKALEEGLLRDEKELAEHNMLVDLGRNDLGRVCRFGSVKLEKTLSIERFSHVMHIGSTVTGRLLGEKKAVDAVGALLPAGTLSGAPKIRACEIIDELEGNRRGIYGGALGYLAFTGDMDLCIAIRLAFKKNGRVYLRSGAGIVADSVPKSEYQECVNKMRAVAEALKKAEGRKSE